MTMLLLLAAAIAAAPSPPRQVTAAEYDRSAQFLPWNKPKMILNDDVDATWIGSTDLVAFRLADEGGWRWMVADPAHGTTRPAFDHIRVAAALGRALGIRVDPRQIPGTHADWPEGVDGPVRLTVGSATWACAESCLDETPPARDPTRAWSPDGRIAIAARGADLSIVDAATGAERRLTTDGTRLQPYGAVAGVAGPVSRRMMGIPVAPIGEFSPDGRYFLTFRLDERRAPERTLIRNAPPGEGAPPEAVTFRASWSGDPPTDAQLVIFDLRTGRMTTVAHPPTRAALVAPVAMAELRWTADSRHFYFVDYADLFRERALFRGDVATGAVERLIVERATTNQYDFLMPPFELLANGGVVWPSDRSGWRQLYRYDRNGRLLNAITTGAFAVREITQVDEAAGNVVFSAGGRDGGEPYLRRLYRVPLAGGNLEALRPSTPITRFMSRALSSAASVGARRHRLPFRPTGAGSSTRSRASTCLRAP